MDKPDVRALAEDVPALEPCPFCGGDAAYDVYGSSAYSIRCIQCNSTSGYYLCSGFAGRSGGQDAARDAWNRRATRETAKAEGRRQGLEEADAHATAARLARVLGIIDRLRWTDYAVLAQDTEPTKSALADLMEFSFMENLQKAHSAIAQKAEG